MRETFSFSQVAGPLWQSASLEMPLTLFRDISNISTAHTHNPSPSHTHLPPVVSSSSSLRDPFSSASLSSVEAGVGGAWGGGQSGDELIAVVEMEEGRGAERGGGVTAAAAAGV